MSEFEFSSATMVLQIITSRGPESVSPRACLVLLPRAEELLMMMANVSVNYNRFGELLEFYDQYRVLMRWNSWPGNLDVDVQSQFT